MKYIKHIRLSILSLTGFIYVQEHDWRMQLFGINETNLFID